jgi:hypothetical protein
MTHPLTGKSPAKLGDPQQGASMGLRQAPERPRLCLRMQTLSCIWVQRLEISSQNFLPVQEAYRRHAQPTRIAWAK